MGKIGIRVAKRGKRGCGGGVVQLLDYSVTLNRAQWWHNSAPESSVRVQLLHQRVFQKEEERKKKKKIKKQEYSEEQNRDQ